MTLLRLKTQFQIFDLNLSISAMSLKYNVFKRCNMKQLPVFINWEYFIDFIICLKTWIFHSILTVHFLLVRRCSHFAQPLSLSPRSCIFYSGGNLIVLFYVSSLRSVSPRKCILPYGDTFSPPEMWRQRRVERFFSRLSKRQNKKL